MSSYQNNLQLALFKAAKVGHIKLMQELIKHGANPGLPDFKGYNAISYAMTANPLEAATWLKAVFATFKPPKEQRDNRFWVQELATGQKMTKEALNADLWWQGSK